MNFITVNENIKDLITLIQVFISVRKLEYCGGKKTVVTVVPESGGRVEIPRLQADGAPVWKFARSVMV